MTAPLTLAVVQLDVIPGHTTRDGRHRDAVRPRLIRVLELCLRSRVDILTLPRGERAG